METDTLSSFHGINMWQKITTKIQEVVSKPPSKGLFIIEPPSELVIQTERQPLVATMDGRLKDAG